jgi:peptidoglycan-N-acetylglucosamine deacetylase
MWRNEKRCAIVLGFDFDAESLWTAVGLTSPTPQSRGHYGARVGLPRILNPIAERLDPSSSLSL